jgi:branched-chain amino acid transport system substrate-binding protein
VIGDDVSDPEAGRVGREQVRRRRREVRGRPLQLRRLDPGLEVYQEAGIVQVTPPPRTRASRAQHVEHVPHLRPRRPAGPRAGAYLSDKFKGKKVAIVHDKTPYGKGLADETQKAMNAKGLKEVLYEGVNTGEKDYSGLVSKLKQQNVDVVYFGGLHTEAGLIIRQMRDQGLQAPMMSGDGIVSAEFTSIAGPGAEGTLMTFAPDPRKNPNAQDGGEEVPRQELRAGGLHALLLRGGPDPGRRGEEGELDGRQEDLGRHEAGPAVQDRDRRHLLRQEGRHHPTGLRHVRLEKGADGKIDYSGNETSM